MAATYIFYSFLCKEYKFIISFRLSFCLKMYLPKTWYVPVILIYVFVDWWIDFFFFFVCVLSFSLDCNKGIDNKINRICFCSVIKCMYYLRVLKATITAAQLKVEYYPAKTKKKCNTTECKDTIPLLKGLIRIQRLWSGEKRLSRTEQNVVSGNILGYEFFLHTT